MGGYCGSPNSVMENNKAQRRSSRNQREWKDYIGTKEVETEDYIKASPELLEEIRIKIQREDKKRKKNEYFDCCYFSNYYYNYDLCYKQY
ncbi:MAG: hypothetical protein HC854_05125 [Flavobacterium sp.]|nr:hypothetical protein [Flavobacterium sp.]